MILSGPSENGPQEVRMRRGQVELVDEGLVLGGGLSEEVSMVRHYLRDLE